MKVSLGDRVRLNVPENARLHGADGVVTGVEVWGAVVRTFAAATGEFRALLSEMVPFSQESKRGKGEKGVGPNLPVGNSTDLGYSGDSCSTCGSLRMRRSGTCQTCEDCGSTSGCS